MTSTPALDPVMTGTLIESTAEVWMALLAVGGFVGLMITAIWFIIVMYSKSTRREKWITLSLALVFTACTVFGFKLTADHEGSDDRELHRDAIVAAVSAKYDIESIRGLDQIDDLSDDKWMWNKIFGSEKAPTRDETVDRLCSPISPDSYELTGVTNGQEIKFRIGFDDCRKPDPQIIITSTPDQAMTPSDLERREHKS